MNPKVIVQLWHGLTDMLLSKQLCCITCFTLVKVWKFQAKYFAANENRVETKVETCLYTEDLRGPGGLIRVFGDLANEKISTGNSIPYCDMSRAQLSFHGHKNSVKFFLAVPGEFFFLIKTRSGCPRNLTKFL